MSEVQLRPFSVYIPSINGDGVYKIIGINVPVIIDPDSGEEILTPEAHDLINKTKFHHRFTANPNEPMNQNQKRIVIIEGDAFDADAIVAIVKYRNDDSKFGVSIKDCADAFIYAVGNANRDKAMALAIEAWRSVVGYLPMVEPTPLPPRPEPEHWSDEKGRYFETYAGLPISIDGHTRERFVWNEGPPRRKNPLGKGASPISKVYVDEAGKPLDIQPI